MAHGCLCTNTTRDQSGYGLYMGGMEVIYDPVSPLTHSHCHVLLNSSDVCILTRKIDILPPTKVTKVMESVLSVCLFDTVCSSRAREAGPPFESANQRRDKTTRQEGHVKFILWWSIRFLLLGKCKQMAPKRDIRGKKIISPGLIYFYLTLSTNSVAFKYLLGAFAHRSMAW